ncbi:DNA cytosine methyltransferase [Oceanobacillus picturae]|uniref:DNA cytosine methyltransferase n=1 Tax=Oceanobacillus picturae TaxID=171693 RepID=UPI001E3299BB|nr:DNA cytosine methyltransferase [Oceanobacillus picturae]
MLHLGDITKIDGGKIPPVHIITFGSPCQDLLNIGKREGLTGSQSSLFYHAIRIIDEMRCATNGTYPVIAVWENVVGAFSSNTGWILKPCWSRSQKPKYQCLLLESGQKQEWSEGMMFICAGACWMPDIGESPHFLKE